MGIFELFILAVGLSMDAFAVSVCKGLAMEKMNWGRACIVGLWFGAAQAIMPLAGWFLGSQFADYITAVDHWIAFALLCLIGGNMVREALHDDGGEGNLSACLDFRIMLALAVATSIDALAVGVTFAFLEVNILRAVCLIGVTTFLLSCAGVKAGNVFGVKYKNKAELAGGAILILLGLKILLEHTGIIA